KVFFDKIKEAPVDVSMSERRAKIAFDGSGADLIKSRNSSTVSATLKKSSTVDGSTTFTQNVTVCRPMPATRDLSEIRFNCRVVRRSRRCHGGCVWREATVKANFVEIMSSLRSNKKYGLLQRDQNGNQALTYGEWLQCLSNHCT